MSSSVRWSGLIHTSSLYNYGKQCNQSEIPELKMSSGACICNQNVLGAQCIQFHIENKRGMNVKKLLKQNVVC